MRILTIEGPDATGKTTILNRLKEIYKDSKIKFLYFPSEGTFGMFANFLMSEFGEFCKQHPSFTAKIFLNDFADGLKNVPCDFDIITSRWLPSSLAYQSGYLNPFSEDEADLYQGELIKEVRKLKLPHPDAIFYLDLPKQLHFDILASTDRSHVFEQDLSFQDRLDITYKLSLERFNCPKYVYGNTFESTDQILSDIQEFLYR